MGPRDCFNRSGNARNFRILADRQYFSHLLCRVILAGEEVDVPAFKLIDKPRVVKRFNYAEGGIRRRDSRFWKGIEIGILEPRPLVKNTRYVLSIIVNI